MPAGIQIINTSGSVTIDETYKNHSLKQIITVPINIDGGFHFVSNITVTEYLPIFAFRCEYGKQLGVIAVTNTSGNTYDIEIAYSGFNTGSNTTATIYVFGPIQDATASTGGLQVFDAAGKLTFDSNLKYVRILDICLYSTGRNTGYVAGTKEAVIFCTPSKYQDGFGGGYQEYTHAMQANSGNDGTNLTIMGLELHDTSDGGTNSDVQASYAYNSMFLVVDVANF